MTHSFYRARRDPDRCNLCGSCERILSCPRLEENDLEACTGCGACVLACPNEAVDLVEVPRNGKIPITVDGKLVSVPDRIPIRTALELLGYRFEDVPRPGSLFAPCGVGGCGSCSVEIDGTLRPCCVTAVQKGMILQTRSSRSYPLRRRIHGWTGHGAGGVGTPWPLKGSHPFIEVAAFACGCNLRCPQCQNWTTTYNGIESWHTPEEAAIRMTLSRRRFGVDRMAISGGECTLNRPWLLSFLQCLKVRNSDPDARFHVDTNATILTPDYLDALVEAGMTDIGPDLKGLTLATFQRITGIHDHDLAERYHTTAWKAVKYLVDRWQERVFIGVGVPYNRALISLEEMGAMGEAIARIDPNLQLSVLDYRPAFRATHLVRPTRTEIAEVGGILRETGLTTVICQTESGYLRI